MQEIFPDIYEVLPSKPTPKKYRSFFVKRNEGNLLFPCFSNHSTIEAHFKTITGLGGLSHQLLGDAHFKSAHCDEVATYFNSPLYCSEREAPDVTNALNHVTQFPFSRHVLSPGIEVIPTPGHRVGGVCFLTIVQGRRYLFVGDFIWHDGEHWIPTATKSGVKTYIESLRLLETIEFDVLLANSVVGNPICYATFDQLSKQGFIADLIKQLP